MFMSNDLAALLFQVPMQPLQQSILLYALTGMINVINVKIYSGEILKNGTLVFQTFK